MATHPEAIAALIREAIAPKFRDDLLAKGQARSMIWRDGALPADAPPFSQLLTYDLLAYAYALIVQGLRLLDQQAELDVARGAFENAASAIEAVIVRSEDSRDRSFHRFVAGACYHLARYSARAYSLLCQGLGEPNLTEPERAVTLLMLRNLDGLESLVAESRLNGRAGDDALLEILSVADEQVEADSSSQSDVEPDDRLFDVVDVALCDNFMAAMGVALLAFERGDRDLLEVGLARLRNGLVSAGELNLVPHWWCHRLAIHLLGELWSSSFHARLPQAPPGGQHSNWTRYRELFIATLLRRNRAEIDLWPSQLVAAGRALDLSDNMVVSLPTSAGKTRIAELCILACLASGRRVVFVTPLRALSAQSEVTLQRTFEPLGKTVSSLYGAIGVGEIDEDFLRGSDIIVATPEKLDFALRNDPDLLNDVGLVVLDEGHMIGLTEREVRYEVQIQRLLRRDDAEGRRIICLSAILPDGKQLEDFTAWLTNDHPQGLVRQNWRPTRLRFGEVVWKRDHARLDISIGSEHPWIEKFLSGSVPPIGRRTLSYPKDQRELCIATAWTLVAEGHSVLIFCPQRRSVEPFATAIVDLAKRGALSSVLDHDPAVLDNAIAIGTEWLGGDSAILACLRLGVAIHHGALPTQFRKEVERLLRRGILKVTVSSPTLAQGLNLSATTLLFHGLKRSRDQIDVAEFRNVVGRAGRAYVDIEGLVLLPMFDDVVRRRAEWSEIIENAKGKEMESGLLRLVLSLVRRMAARHPAADVDTLLAYLTGNMAWEFPTLAAESSDVAALEQSRWVGFLTTLDTAILSILGESDVADADIEATLDAVLASSLWSRRLTGKSEATQRLLKAGLVARTRHIWSRTSTTQRRAYFLAGVGLTTGEALDASAPKLNALLAAANGAILNGDGVAAIDAVVAFAEIVFTIKPFAPDDLPANWREVLTSWLDGQTIARVAEGHEDDVLLFIEHALVYRLPWAMEAVRIRAIASRDSLPSGLMMEDLELRAATAAVETGTLSGSATVLMRAGFDSRVAAISAVRQTAATFSNISEMRDWLREDSVAAAALDPTWPTPESHDLWSQFVRSIAPTRQGVWHKRVSTVEVEWDDAAAHAGKPLRLWSDDRGTLVLDADFTPLGRLKSPLNPKRLGLACTVVASDQRYLEITYLGPSDMI